MYPKHLKNRLQLDGKCIASVQTFNRTVAKNLGRHDCAISSPWCCSVWTHAGVVPPAHHCLPRCEPDQSFLCSPHLYQPSPISKGQIELFDRKCVMEAAGVVVHLDLKRESAGGRSTHGSTLGGRTWILGRSEM
jgi:hypothetical protein